MNFQLLSDVHLDFHKDQGVEFVASLPVASDTLVLAGDLCEGPHVVAAVRLFLARWKTVILVLGNHDYYRIDPEQLRLALRGLELENSNFHWLHNNSVEVEGVAFHGTTLWFPPATGVEYWSRNIADSRLIPNYLPWVREQHALARAFLERVRRGDVLVTHHMPHEMCVSPRFQGSPLNAFFVGAIGDILDRRRPSVVCSGHTHDPYDIQYSGSTRLVANPFGYPREDQSRFRPGLVIEVS